jgi:hypothetical protein
MHASGLPPGQENAHHDWEIENKAKFRVWIRMALHFFGSWARIHIRVKSLIRIRIEVKIENFFFRGSKWSRGGPWTLKMEAWRLKMEAWRVCRPLVADSPHVDVIRIRIRIRVEVKS